MVGRRGYGAAMATAALGEARQRWIWRGVGEAQEPRREWGQVGGGIEEAGAWRPYPLLDACEGVRWGRAPIPTLVGGTGKGRERPGERAGSAGWARWAGLAVSWAVWSSGGSFSLFSFFLLSSAFVFSFLLFLFLFYFI